MKQCAGEKQICGFHSTNGPDRKHVFCGICDDKFDIEKEFMDPYIRYCDDPQKDTFLELFQIHLLSYFPWKKKTN